jgi:aerotaxis receptor
MLPCDGGIVGSATVTKPRALLQRRSVPEGWHADPARPSARPNATKHQVVLRPTPSLRGAGSDRQIRSRTPYRYRPNAKTHPMRTNLPITSHEYSFAANETLVSVTDTKGRITYCNPAFVHVSGYEQDELLGQPHNLIRHPSMPSEAFRDLWQTITSGLPWTGLVKNRRKNGDFYWVQANVTPLRDGSEIIGFLSVRTLPSREQVESAEKLYAAMRAEADAGRCVHTLRHGTVVRKDLVGWLARLRSPSTPMLVTLVQALAVGVALLPAWFSAPWPLTVGVAAMATAMSVFMVRALTLAPLQALVQDAYHLASGELSYTVTTGASGSVGELQRALFQLSVNVRTVVSDVRQEVQNLEIAVQEIAYGNNELSARTETQASSLEQTAASMEEINGTVQNSAASASRGARYAEEASGVTQHSNDAVQALGETMQGIADSSRRIEDIVHLIEGVAFQTNILALNAAVEAARAGEAGRGFAVVASEVRMLAARTTQAARDIKQLIAASAARVAQGAGAAGEARERMADALQAVQRVTTVLSEISTAASEQQMGISQVNEAVAHMDSITQQNAAMVEELAAAAQSLHGQVGGVSSSMRLFRLGRGETTLSTTDAVALRRAASGKQLLGLQ